MNELWEETGGEKEYQRLEEERKAKEREIEEGLARCSVCGEKAGIHKFGIDERGIWIGCCRTMDCTRYVEYHSEGWSIEDTARDWNRYNGGLFRVVRIVKRKISKVIGRREREWRRMEREEREKKIQSRNRLRELLGIKEKVVRKKWWKVW